MVKLLFWCKSLHDNSLMKMKILCPTDFSPASINAIEYAANFAKFTKSSMTLLHVVPVMVSTSEGHVSGGPDSRDEFDEAGSQLKAYCEKVASEYAVPCNYESIASVIKGVERTISEESPRYDITIIGTNGADNLSQFYLGSHSFRVAKHQTGPMIIVPEDCVFREIVNVAFASDCHIGDTLLLEQLKRLTDNFKPRVRVVHVSEKDTALSREVYKAFCSLVEETLNYDQQIIFERIIHANKSEAIEDFMKKTNADLLALYMEEHCLLYNVFHKSIVKKLTSYVSFPILVFHK